MSDAMEKSQQLTQRLLTLLYEAGALLLALLAVMGLLALLSYQAQDPGWHNVAQLPAQNWMGLSGAWVADVVFSLLGQGGWFLPLALAHLAIQLLRQPWQAEDWSPFIPSLRLLGLLLVVVAVASLAAQHFNLDSRLPYGAGGILGVSLLSSLAPWLGHLGLTLLMLSLLLLGVSLLGGFSWLAVMDELGHGLVQAYAWLASQWPKLKNYLTHHWQAWRAPAAETSVIAQAGRVVHRPQPPRLEQEPVLSSPQGLAPVPPPASQAIEPDLDPPWVVPETTSAQQVVSIEHLHQPAAASRSGGAPPSPQDLDAPSSQPQGFSHHDLEMLAAELQQRLSEFGVRSEVEEVHPGPVVTRFELSLAAGVKSSRVANLSLDLARALKVPSVRVVEVISGKSTIGVELPNAQRALIRLQQVLASPVYQQDQHPLPLGLGLDISGQPVIANLAKMPHLLVAGTTGSGKSVGINAMLMSLLLQRRPEELRLIMIDPKMLELSVYEGIPHLLCPVVTDMKEAAHALRWCVAEMEKRYQLMSSLGVRNLDGYNARLAEATAQGLRIRHPKQPEGEELYLEPLPYIVVVVDEFADMIMLVGKKVEELIARLAQKARAAGIHLILATQRPSVDVITGLIKANIPTRVAFQVSSKIDSRTILDQGGAEQLLGQGDLLYLPTGAPQPERVHCAFVDDSEVHRVVEAWKQVSPPQYIEEVLTGAVEAQALAGLEDEEASAEQDALYDEAVAFVLEQGRASTSSVQRRFKIGYNRAARLIDAMEAAGLVSPLQSNGQRELLVPHAGQS
ncbi:DNA translocase FtsK 4TM domain-containing protein [Marinospirillum sp. MEB164]|uniref:DNA translocase FtsK n=1 Tax=Marinospirillum alkalitolerans TaxID=3123374 RepID=A0ABW8PYJ9_9GAMM